MTKSLLGISHQSSQVSLQRPSCIWKEEKKIQKHKQSWWVAKSWRIFIRDQLKVHLNYLLEGWWAVKSWRNFKSEARVSGFIICQIKVTCAITQKNEYKMKGHSERINIPCAPRWCQKLMKLPLQHHRYLLQSFQVVHAYHKRQYFQK